MSKRQREVGARTLGDVALRVRETTHTRKQTDKQSSEKSHVENSLIDPRKALLADFCRMLVDGGGSLQGISQTPEAQSLHELPEVADLPPRLRQTLTALLAGDSEKQVALRLQISPHTVHVYVKSLYKRFGVASRGELLARWVRPAILK